MNSKQAIAVGAGALVIAYAFRKAAKAADAERNSDIAGGQDELESPFATPQFVVTSPNARSPSQPSQEQLFTSDPLGMQTPSASIAAPDGSPASFDGGFSSIGGGSGGVSYNITAPSGGSSSLTPASGGSSAASFLRGAAVIGGSAAVTGLAGRAAVKAASFVDDAPTPKPASVFDAAKRVVTDPYGVRAEAQALSSMAQGAESTAAKTAAGSTVGPVARFAGKAAGFIPIAGTLTGAAADKYFTRNDPNKPTWWQAISANFVGDVAQLQVTGAAAVGGAAVGGPAGAAIGAVGGTVGGFTAGLAAQEGYYKAVGASNMIDSLFSERAPSAVSALPAPAAPPATPEIVPLGGFSSAVRSKPSYGGDGRVSIPENKPNQRDLPVTALANTSTRTGTDVYTPAPSPAANYSSVSGVALYSPAPASSSTPITPSQGSSSSARPTSSGSGSSSSPRQPSAASSSRNVTAKSTSGSYSVSVKPSSSYTKKPSIKLNK